MVEELDLTDQGVSTVAAMIDSEIWSHISDWDPRKTSPDVEKGNPARLSLKSNLPLKSIAVPPSGFQLERLPSGHIYWCDSPKGEGLNNRNKLGNSNLSSPADTSDIGDDSISEKDKAPDDCTDGDSPSYDNSDSSSGNTIDKDDSKSPASNESDQVGAKYKILMDYESEDVKKVVDDLKNLLEQQQKEVDELKRKHELAKAELLRDLSPEMRQNVLNLCKLKIPTDELLP